MTKRLLWTDDDGRERFIYEERMLQRDGWEVHWAEDVEEATKKLSTERFDVVILDQMFPLQRARGQGDAAPRIWGGCLLLWWLRRQCWPADLPYAAAAADYPIWAVQPLPENRSVPAIIISAIYDEQVEQVTAMASDADRDLERLSKPLRFSDLQSFLRTIAEDRS